MLKLKLLPLCLYRGTEGQQFQQLLSLLNLNVLLLQLWWWCYTSLAVASIGVAAWLTSITFWRQRFFSIWDSTVCGDIWTKNKHQLARVKIAYTRINHEFDPTEGARGEPGRVFILLARKTVKTQNDREKKKEIIRVRCTIIYGLPLYLQF